MPWLARHGSTAWSERGRLQGWAPIGLSAHGIAEAHHLGAWARTQSISVIRTSPLRRACETALIVARYVAAPVHVDRSLCELNYGQFTGCTLDELAAAAPELARVWTAQPWQARFAPHGALDDIAKALEPLIGQTRTVADSVLCITHGHVIRAARTLRAELTAEDFWGTDIPAGSYWPVGD